MKTTRIHTFTLAVLVGTLTFSGVAGAFEPAAHPRTTRESVSSTGTPAVGTIAAQAGSLSANGRYVVFMSNATNLTGVAGNHVYRHDRTTGATVRDKAADKADKR